MGHTQLDITITITTQLDITITTQLDAHKQVIFFRLENDSFN
jgi:hypothetical protein